MRRTLAIVAMVGLAGGLAAWMLISRAEPTTEARSEEARPEEVRSEEARSGSLEVSRLAVEGMVCSGCAAAVRMAAQDVDGVTDVEVSYDDGQAKVTYDPSKTTPEAIANMVSEKSGFRATVPERPRS